MYKILVQLRELEGKLDVEFIHFEGSDRGYLSEAGSPVGFRALAFLLAKSSIDLSAAERTRGIDSPYGLIYPLRNAIRNGAKWLWSIFNSSASEPMDRKSKKEMRESGEQGIKQSSYLHALGSDTKPRVKVDSSLQIDVLLKEESGRNRPATLAEIQVYLDSESKAVSQENVIRKIEHRIEVVRSGADDRIVVRRDSRAKGLCINDHLSIIMESTYETNFAVVWMDWGEERVLEPLYPFRWTTSYEKTPLQARVLEKVTMPTPLADSKRLALPATGFYTVDKAGLHCLLCISTEKPLSELGFMDLLLSLDKTFEAAPKPMSTYPSCVEFASSPIPRPKRVDLALGHPDKTIWSEEFLSHYKGCGDWIDLIAMPHIE